MESFELENKPLTISGSKSFMGHNLYLELIKKQYSVNFLSSRIEPKNLLKDKNIDQTLNSIKGHIIILSGWPIHNKLIETKTWCDHMFILLSRFLMKDKKNYLLCFGSAAELNPSNDNPLDEYDFTYGIGDYGMSKIYLLTFLSYTTVKQ